MEYLSSADYKRLFWFIGEIYARRTQAELARTLTEDLSRLVRCDVASINAVDQRTAVFTATDFPSGTCTPELRAVLTRAWFTHPVMEHVTRAGDSCPYRISDFMSLRQFRATAAYGDFYAKLRLHHELSFAMWPGAAEFCIVALDRKHRDFTDREQAMIALLAPHAANALRIVTLFGREINTMGRSNLTVRECEIMQLVAGGATNPQVGRVLRISARTVQKHLEHIYRKLDVGSRTAAAQLVTRTTFPSRPENDSSSGRLRFEAST